MRSTLISNIQGYSIHDGPGIRTTVFLKGCNLRCKWCANPENLEARVKVGFLKNLCSQCLRCAAACPNGAILPGEDHRIDRSKCVSCGTCVDACYFGALVRYGEEMTSDELFQKVRRDKMFYGTSNGGVTVSGGEPLIHAEFVAELFEACHGDGINTCVETCGCVPRQAVETVEGCTDYFYFDLKIMDRETHIRYTGRDNDIILDNARYLAGRGANILFRQPLIPTVNDNEENVVQTARFIRSLGRDDLALQIMPYHRMGLSKYNALDKPYEMPELQIMPADDVNAVRDLYIANGVNCSVSR